MPLYVFGIPKTIITEMVNGKEMSSAVYGYTRDKEARNLPDPGAGRTWAMLREVEESGLNPGIVEGVNLKGFWAGTVSWEAGRDNTPPAAPRLVERSDAAPGDVERAVDKIWSRIKK